MAVNVSEARPQVASQVVTISSSLGRACFELRTQLAASGSLPSFLFLSHSHQQRILRARLDLTNTQPR